MSVPLADRVSDRTRRRVAWALPVVVVGAVVSGVALTAGSASGSSPDLPARTAQQLLVAVQGSDVTALSGVVNESANLGLPSLPGERSAASLSWQSFVTGSHSAKVWIDGRDKQRAALLGELSEADVVHNGRDVWTYTSDSNVVTHTVLPARHRHDSDSSDTRDARNLTPSALATKVLTSVSPSTEVSVDNSRMVADRAAYTLVIRPRDARSTVQKVTIAIDAKKFVPLQVQIFGSGSSPALQTGFTSISFTKPAASTFTFTKPAGATVSDDAFGSGRGHHGKLVYRGAYVPESRLTHGRAYGSTLTVTPDGDYGRQGYAPLSSLDEKPKVIGSGWTRVLKIPAGQGADLGNPTLQNLESTGASGQQVVHTALLNAVFAKDGSVFVGAVDLPVLERIAASN